MSREGEAEYKKWGNAEYPYDEAECGWCATFHRDGCKLPAHQEMVAAAKKLGLTEAEIWQRPRRFRRLILAFRKRFARFYPRRGK